MTIYLITNSTGLPSPGGLTQRIGAKVFKNDTCVTQALYTLKKIKLQPEDFVIFNEGINDCIYRKDKDAQGWMIGEIWRDATKEGDKETLKLMKEKRDYLDQKPDEELFQFLSFEEFDGYIDSCFKLFQGQGIVLSVQKFSPTSKKIGWAYEEILKTNIILKRKAEDYGLTYVDLFDKDVEHYDDIHCTEHGFDQLTEIIRKELERKNIQIVMQKLEKKKKMKEVGILRSIIDDKVCIITGSSKGLGKIIAKTMVQNGYKVVINYYTDEATALETKRELELEYPDSQIMTYKANVGSESEVSAMVAKVVEKFGSVNILINNAGINVDSISWKMEKDSWDRVIATNLTGAFLCTKHVLPIMRQNNWGRIIFISSVVGQTGAFGASNYTASKAGLFGFAKSVAKEVANKNITVNVIACGYTTVGMGARLPEEISKKVLEKIPMGRFGTPEEIADLVLFLITASYITGQVIAIDGGLT